MKPSKVKKAKKAPGVQGRASSAKKSKHGTKRTPATQYSPPVTAAQQQDLSAQVSELQAQIAALKALVEQSQATASQVSNFQSQVSASSPATDFPVSGIKSQVSSSIPIYELKETRPVGYQSSDLLDSSSEETQVGFFTGLLDRARLQWLMGDWEELSKIDLEQIQHHPDRAKLAALAAGAMLQIKLPHEAKKIIAISKRWGAKPQALQGILIAGIHGTLSSIAALKQDFSRSRHHLKMSRQRLGLPEKAQDYIGSASTSYTQSLTQNQAGALDSLPLTTAKFLKYDATRPTSRLDRAKYFNENGEKLYKQRVYKLAAEYFQRAFDLVPKEAWYCQNLAEAIARLDYRKGESWECAHLGATIEATGKWEVAVRYYRLALKLSQQSVEAHRESQTFAVSPPQATQVSNPVFIVGCGHSGTSLLLAMLGCHKHLHPIPKETALFLKDDKCLELALGEFDKACLEARKTMWIEKTPPHIFQIHRFLAFRPQSRILLILRDGRDVVCSLKYRAGYLSVEDRLERWIYDNLAAASYWQHPRLHVVKYESLVEKPEIVLQDICAFLEEEFDPAMLDFHRQERNWYASEIAKPGAIQSDSDHKAHRNWQINQPLFDGGGRWKAEMTSYEKQAFKDSPAQKILEQFGYATNNDW